MEIPMSAATDDLMNLYANRCGQILATVADILDGGDSNGVIVAMLLALRKRLVAPFTLRTAILTALDVARDAVEGRL